MREHTVSYRDGDITYYLYEDPDDQRTIIVHNNMEESVLNLDEVEQSSTEIHINLDNVSVDRVRELYGKDVANKVLQELHE